MEDSWGPKEQAGWCSQSTKCKRGTALGVCTLVPWFVNGRVEESEMCLRGAVAMARGCKD